MQAEQLIALEAALADLSRLYPVARSLVALHDAAEHQLLPLLSRMGARLRSLCRHQQLDEAVVMQVATQIMSESAHWHEALASFHSSETFQAALGAWRNNDQNKLKTTIPQVLSDYSMVPSPPTLSFPFAITRPHRRPGTSPFLGVDACAQQIESVIANGIGVEAATGSWWDSELQPLTCAAEPAQLAASVALRKEMHGDNVAVFSVADDTTLRVFVPLVPGPFTVVLAAQAEDEWWDAYEHIYSEFRTALASELASRGHRVELAT